MWLCLKSPIPPEVRNIDPNVYIDVCIDTYSYIYIYMYIYIYIYIRI